MRTLWSLLALAALPLLHGHTPAAAPELPPVVRTAMSGKWSAPTTWEGGKLPDEGARVLIRTGHRVVYDLHSGRVIRSINVAGTLAFAPDRDTRLDVGLIKIQAGEEFSEDGFDCEGHIEAPKPGTVRPALEVGTPEQPIDPAFQAVIRLHQVPGLDKEKCPAIIACGGRLDLHGAPLSRTWVKLGANVKSGDTKLTLSEAVTGWHVGDRVILTGTSVHGTRQTASYTEERIITGIDGTTLTVDRAVQYDHAGTGDYRGEVANLSRNVIIESADPEGGRGHTMYHKYSAGSLSYAELRHLGKENLLGKYAIHFHLCRDTMRGSSVVGCSIWDSKNRWLTIHGTDYLVVRDNVGYGSVGHGYFLEDGTEVNNVLDRNLAVLAKRGKRLPKQVLPFDANEGAGFWWSNSRNTFTRNVACENDLYGFRYEATQGSSFKLTLSVPTADGTTAPVDIRTLPFVRFDDNEVHSGHGLYGVNLGEGVNRVGPDTKHPFIVRNLTIWDQHYGFRPQVPSLLVDGLRIHRVAYGVYHPNYDNHVYRNVLISQTHTEPFNRGHDDASVQYGPLTVDGLTFDGCRSGGMPLIQISDDNPTGKAESHFRNVKVVNWADGSKAKAIANLGGGPRPQPKSAKGVPLYLHDWREAGRTVVVASTRSPEFKADPARYRVESGLTGDESRVADAAGVAFPNLLDPVDDLPPATVITSARRAERGNVVLRGVVLDNGTVKQVLVNGSPAKLLPGGEWEVTLGLVEGSNVQAHAIDAAGNVEKRPHVVVVP